MVNWIIFWIEALQWEAFILHGLMLKEIVASHMVYISCSPIWIRKVIVSVDLNAVSDSEQSCYCAFFFPLQIERINQLFAVGGLRHLMFYYQDVEVAETGIQIWCDLTQECAGQFIGGGHEAEGHCGSWAGSSLVQGRGGEARVLFLPSGKGIENDGYLAWLFCLYLGCFVYFFRLCW